MEQSPAGDFGQIVKMIAAGAASFTTAHALAEGTRVSPRAGRILAKSAVGAQLADDAEWHLASAAWIGSIQEQSALARIAGSGMHKVAPRQAVGIVASTLTAGIAGNGLPIPVSKLGIDRNALVPTTAGVILVVSEELALDISAGASNLLSSELKAAVALAADDAFFGLTIDSATPSTPSTAIDEPGWRRELRWLLDQVGIAGGSSPIWVGAPDVVRRISTLSEIGLNVAPDGGELLNCPLVSSVAVPPGILRLVDAKAIAGSILPVEIDSSRNADVQMADNPVVGAAAMVSMFQTNSVAVRALLPFCAARTRSNAIAELTAVAWGDELVS
ncbi:hypothetical protein D3874_06940 [Oleomonas cavernae]|uniref:Phage major capsid protein n=1 Tax=Oleomonas cavernae TaxID=2320859 RepID=A0A418W9Y8_9PROT|nr:hypothetical protein [Oleomonas cavernae]RJF86786.1 hypothetical protein D3874_06940 [Oleomonas cavernae]